MGSILGPPSSEFISIETLAGNSTSPANIPLLIHLGLELLWLNPDGFTLAHTYIPILPMEEVISLLPSSSTVSSSMKYFPPLSVKGDGPSFKPPTSTLGIQIVFSMAPTNFPSDSITIHSSILTIVVDPS